MNMKKGISGIVLLILIYISNSYSQKDTLNLKEVSIISSRIPLVYDDASRVIAIIDKKEIETSTAVSLQDILEYALNADVRQRGVFGVQSDLSIRGGSFDQNLILLNGIKINDPQTGHHNLNLPVDISQVERIEILNGPGSRIFGPNAFSGVVNVITRGSEKNAFNIDLAGGDNYFLSTSASMSYNTKKVDQFISFAHRSSDGYTENTDFNIFNLFYKNSLHLKKGETYLQAGYTNKSFGANSFYTPAFPDQYEQTNTTYANLGFQSEKKNLVANVYFRRHQDRFELFRYQKPEWYNNHNYHLTYVYGSEIKYNFKTRLGKTAVGTEFYNEDILSNVLGEDINEPEKVPFENNKFFTKSKSRSNAGLYAEHSIKLKKFRVSGGVMGFWNSDFDLKFFPGMDMSYEIVRNFRVFGSANKSFRLPTYTDLYYTGPTNLGNPDLVPEEAATYEAGIKYLNKYFIFHTSYYQRNGRNIIDWVRLSDTLLWESQNLTEVNSRGFEVSGKFYVKARFPKMPIEFVNVNYAYNELTKESGEYISKYALDHLRHQLNIKITHSIFKGFKASWAITYRDRNGQFVEYPSNEVKDFKPYALTDLKLFYQAKGQQVYLNIYNLFNENYTDISNLQMPGRFFFFGVKYNFRY
jgi:vitamin B12 transporter